MASDQQQPNKRKCIHCHFDNSHHGILCLMCNKPLFNQQQLNNLIELTWKQITKINYNKLKSLPVWIKCCKCSKWRTTKLSMTSNIFKQEMNENWECNMNNTNINSCSMPQQKPNKHTHSALELLALVS